MSKEWAKRVDPSEAARRAGGRRAYNWQRRLGRLQRRLAVRERLQKAGWHRGLQAALAREFGVSEATICRDVESLMKACCFCPLCASLVAKEQLGSVGLSLAEVRGRSLKVGLGTHRMAYSSEHQQGGEDGTRHGRRG